MINCESDNIFSDDRGEAHLSVCLRLSKKLSFSGSLFVAVAFDRMLKKPRPPDHPFSMRQFCVSRNLKREEKMCPQVMNFFLRKFAFYTWFRTKHKINLTFRQAEAHLSVCLISTPPADILFAGADGVPRTSATNILQHDRCHFVCRLHGSGPDKHTRPRAN